MSNFQLILKKVPFYILFIGLYPVLFLWYVNFYQIQSPVILQSLLLSVFFSLLFLLFFVVCFRSVKKGSIVTLVVLILFYSYGHVFSLLDNKYLFGFLVGRHRFFFPLNVLIGFGVSFFLLKMKFYSDEVTRSLNIFFGIFAGLILIQIGISSFSASMSMAANSLNPILNLKGNQLEENPATPDSRQNSGLQQPDIYYIVMDGYSRSDLLSEGGFNNRDFLNSLRELGFIIPKCGQSNYDKTALSIASTLNMGYLDELGIKQKDLKYPLHQRILETYIKNNLVRSKLHELDYQFVTNVSSFFFLDIPDSDIYFKDDYSKNFFSSEIFETIKFQQLFINTTFARTFIEWININPENSKIVPLPIIKLLSPMSQNIYSNFFEGTNYSHYQLGRYHLENLENVTDIPDKKFVYSHFLITHKPYVFTATGDYENIDQASYTSYLNSIKFLNEKMLKIINIILAKSATPPIIILQSDHSYIENETSTTKNFQAYYFPGLVQDDIDEGFTNVNTFRLVFSKYLGEDLPLLPNKSFMIDYKNPSNMQILEKSCTP